jgi:L-gulonolactone oxidase
VSTGADAWANWAGNQSASGFTRRRPREVEDVVAIVRQAAGRGQRVRTVGSGHSFTGIARPDPGMGTAAVHLVLDRLSGVTGIDTERGLVTVLPGTPLHELNLALERAGLAMTNLGDIDAQTIAGATSTGTHGTGAAFGGLATQIRALDLVLADGALLTCSADRHPEVFAAARVGLGALAVISSLTLAVEPLFPMTAEERPMRLEETLERFDEMAAGTDHVEFYWFPHTRMTSVKRNTRLPPGSPLHPLPRWREWWDDEFLSNSVFGAMVGLGRRVPASVPPMARIAARALGARTFTDVSHRVFTSPRRVRFAEMEYAVPRRDLLDVLREIVAAVDAAGLRISFPVEVRVSAADDIPLSTASGRDTGYIAVHLPPRAERQRYFGLVEGIAGQAGGRPHWGKLHGLDADVLRTRYPRFEEFVGIRDRLDPRGLFRNDYLDRVLGPPGAPG